MRIFIAEGIETPQDIKFLILLIAKEISDHMAIFLNEKKLLAKNKKNPLLKKLNFDYLEVVEDMDKNRSEVEIKKNMFSKDTLVIVLGKDFYEYILEFKNMPNALKPIKEINNFEYVVRILNMILANHLIIALANRVGKA